MKQRYSNKLVYLLVVLTFWSCNTTPTETKEVVTPISVAVAKVTKANAEQYLYFNGTTQYLKKQGLRSGVTGYLDKLYFTIGDNISSGQMFASLHTKEQQALQKVVKKDSSLEKFIKPIVVKSKVTGIITAVNVAQGSYVSEGDVLAMVTEPESLVVNVSVPYEQTKFINIGTPCVVIINGNSPIHCNITGMLPTVDVATQTQNYLITLPKTVLPENVKVQVGVVTNTVNNGIVIPKEALQTDELMENYWVLQVVHDTLAVKRKVTPVFIAPNDSLIPVQGALKEGALKEGDVIVTAGAYQMDDKTLVKVHK